MIESKSPMQENMEFETTLSNLFDSWTGTREKAIKERTPVADAEGKVHYMMVASTVRVPVKGSIAFMNEAGANRVTSYLRSYMSKHNLFADLNIDEIANLAADAAVDVNIILHKDFVAFGIKDLEDIGVICSGLQNSLTLYLSSLRAAGYRGTFEKTNTFENKQTQQQMPVATPQPGIFGK